ncbi:amphoterin-induced protein 1-like isoform X2 [Gouania willdenowi]|uniref:Amphoterin-induced protein 1-like n=2 Tax=Gouania willdenowi TaxID=441366 RepID=A0A8C5E9V7_GOUWI|nr:amphoterin-induced protein 1-like isoform X2 [Gouania willdenowi]
MMRRRSSISVLHLALVMVTVSGQFMGSPLDCLQTCVCASNIISCSRRNLTNVPTALPRYTAVLDLSFNSIQKLRAEWTPFSLSRMDSLLLSNNGLTFLSSEAFAYVKKLRYLDLSSNGLRLLDEFIFEPLEHLEVLLLYNNHISQIDRSAFAGLTCLQRLYMSQNQISRFPLELVKERSRLETLTLLDVSSNRIKTLPLQEMKDLPAWINNGLYFHNNSLTCSCDLYELLARWHLKELRSATDYKGSHTCVIPGQRKEKLSILDLDKVYLNCSEVKINQKEALLDQFLILDCDTRQKDMVKTWVLPGNLTLPFTKTAVTLEGGSLQIGPLSVEDSGVYTCFASSDSLNETIYVTVVVFNSTLIGGLQNLKTAYTTLIGCVISIVMVFIYLYLTPCNCPCCPGEDLEKQDPGDSLLSVSLPQAHEESGLEGVEGRGLLSRKAAFQKPRDLQEMNGRLNAIGEEEEDCDEEKKEEGRESDAQSVSSVCSDTPMML